jgi:glycerol kinase
LSEKPFILALDQGTTSSRAIVFNHSGDIVSIAQKEFTQIFPKSGWVEHDPVEIWSSQASVISEALAKKGIDGAQIAAIGITNQRETTIVWDRETGEPVYNAIVWQDRRTAAYCDQLKEEGYAATIQQKTGLVVDAYFSASKIKWILDHVDGAREKAEAGKLAFGTVDSWLIWKFTRGKVHVSDITNASRTMLFNIRDQQWDPELIQLFEIPETMLPEVVESSGMVARSHPSILNTEIPIAGIAGDQQAALFGQMCTQSGMVKNTYGTGCFMLMNTGSDCVISEHNLLSTIAWKIDGNINYALEGSVFIAGAVVQWLRDGLKLFSSSAEVEDLARQVPDTDGVYLVPAFAGLGAPYWNQDAKGTIVGISRGTRDAHFARAALESMAFQTMDVLRAMQADSGIDIAELRVDGGATANDFLMQFQSDVLQCDVIRPQITETTALGAAYLAGLAVGYWSSMDEIQAQWKEERAFRPERNAAEIKEDIESWKRAVDTARFWADQTESKKN